MSCDVAFKNEIDGYVATLMSRGATGRSLISSQGRRMRFEREKQLRKKRRGQSAIDKADPSFIEASKKNFEGPAFEKYVEKLKYEYE